MFDVSVSTIYRAIEAGQLGALRLGKGKGAVRIPAQALTSFAAACAEAAGRPRYPTSGQGTGPDLGRSGEVT